MRVLYLNFDRGIPVLGDKGASVHVRAVTTALTRMGHDVTLVCSALGSGNAPPPVRLIELPVDTAHETLAIEAARRGLPDDCLNNLVTRRELGVLAHDRSLPGRVQAALAQSNVRPDIIYERHALFHAAGIALARTFDVPRILEVNAPLAEEQERFRGLSQRDLATALESRSWTDVHLAVAVSDDVRRRMLAAGADPARVIVGPNGVDTRLFRSDEAGAGIVRERYGLGTDLVIGFVGSFKAWHGVDFLIECLNRLRAERVPARLLAVGTGPMVDQAQALAASLGLANAVTFTGAVPHEDVPKHLAAMDITVAPYPAQPNFYFSPLKVVESLATGRPVVAPRIGQIESLITDGVTGLLYQPDDLDGCVAAIATLLGAEAATRVAATWDWTALIGRILDRAAGLPRLPGDISAAVVEAVR
jgi:glycosyltransferase involved in cell wall biosynthesis